MCTNLYTFKEQRWGLIPKVARSYYGLIHRPTQKVGNAPSESPKRRREVSKGCMSVGGSPPTAAGGQGREALSVPALGAAPPLRFPCQTSPRWVAAVGAGSAAARTASRSDRSAPNRGPFSYGTGYSTETGTAVPANACPNGAFYTFSFRTQERFSCRSSPGELPSHKGALQNARFVSAAPLAPIQRSE